MQPATKECGDVQAVCSAHGHCEIATAAHQRLRSEQRGQQGIGAHRWQCEGQALGACLAWGTRAGQCDT